MGLFDEVLSALNNPDQQANSSQLGGILSAVQQLASSQNADASTTQTVVSVVGGYVRSALQEQRTTQGAAQVEALVNQFSGTAANPAAVQALFTPAQQRQVAEAVAQRTGLSAETIEGMLPMVIPVVLNFLQSGSRANPSSNPSGNNSVLNTFLDGDGDGDIDVGDALSLANRFMNRG